VQSSKIGRNQAITRCRVAELFWVTARTRGSGLAGVEQSQVYRDQIDAHFSSIDITAWRKLAGLSLQKLARINLIAGGNNSGKTSLLEAIYLLTRQNDVTGVLETVRRRAKLSFEQMQPAWLIEQLPNDATISGNFDGKESEVGIQTKLEGNASIDRTRFLATIEVATSFGQNRQESVTHLFRDGERQMTAEAVKLLCPCVLSSPFFLNEPQHHTYYYFRSVQSKALDQIIIKFLRENILPTLKNIYLVDESQRFMVDDESFKSAMDLTNYGEGLQRIFFMSLVFAAANNGVVLIDEFENAVHADLLPEFSRLVLELAKRFNVQVFLTSHSKEAIDAFSKNQADAKDFSYHALVQRDGKIVALNYDGETFAKLKSLANIDLRRAA
jgi:AAA15 family ATPase/GTPase